MGRFFLISSCARSYPYYDSILYILIDCIFYVSIVDVSIVDALHCTRAK